MKKIILIITLIFTTSLNAQNYEIQKVIETFFEGFHTKDSIKIKTVCSNSLKLQSIIESKNGTKLKDESPKQFYISISSMPKDLKFEERILKYSIQIDGAMAHVWTPYEFYINGVLSHSGVNAFTLFKENNHWKIIYIIDTRRKNK